MEPMRSVDLSGHGTLVVRAMSEADLPALARLYGRLSPEDRRRRFFSAGTPPMGFLERWYTRTRDDGVGLIAAVIDDPTGGTDGDVTIVADAGYVLLPDGSGELAITVDPTWRGWLGHYVLDALVEAAAERGVETLEADVLVENRTMMSLLDARGFAVMDHPDWNTVRMVIGTRGRIPTWPGPHDRPRILVEVPGGRWHAEEAATRAGYQVLACPGPRRGPGGRCPHLDGEPCPLAEGADAVVVSLVMDDTGQEILHQHRELYPEVPVCVSSVRSSDLEAGASEADEVVPTSRDMAPLLAALERLTGGPRESGSS